MGYRLGVDLGTTWTAAAAFDGQTSTPVRLGTTSAAMPSVVAVDGEQMLVGDAAGKRATLDPPSGAREMKRRLGDSTPFVLNGTPYSPESLLGRILASAVATSTEQLGPPDSVVLTHPATWGAFKIDLLAEAARVAGLDAVEFVAEPVAAAGHYARLGKVPSGATIAVYDFGGGTFDAAIVHDGDDGLELIGTAEGLDRLGGVDFDQAVLAHVVAALDGQLDDLDRSDPAVRNAMAALRDEAVAAKEALSSDTEASIAVQFPTLSTEVRITRNEFETAIRPRVQETLNALDRTLAAANLQYDALHSVLLVGGSSRIPLVTEMVAAHTGRPVATDVDTKAAVCCGAASWKTGDLNTVNAAAVTEISENASPPGTGAKPATTESHLGAAARKVGRAAAVGGVGLAATAAVVTGAAAAYAATQDDDPASSQPNDDKDSAKANADESSNADNDTSQRHNTGGSDPANGQPSPSPSDATHSGSPSPQSLDAFDEITGQAPPVHHASSGPSGQSAPLHREPARGSADPVVPPPSHAQPQEHTGTPSGSSDPMSQQPDTMTSPPDNPTQDSTMTTQHKAQSSNNDEQVAQVQQALRAHLDSWQPPAGATDQEVHDLKAELEGLIDRFDPADGVSFDNAAGDLQQRLDASLQDFSQSEQLDRMHESQQSAQAAAQQGAVAKVEFKQYTDALEAFAKDWDPSWPAWVDQASLAAFREQEIPGILASVRFNPDASLRLQQEHAESVVRSSLQKWQQDQYRLHHQQASDRMASEAQRLEFIARDETATAEDRSEAVSDLSLLKDQQRLNDAQFQDSHDLPATSDPTADDALHQHLEPQLGDTMVTEMQNDHVSIAALLDDGARGFAETSISKSSMIADVFDDGSDSADDSQMLAAVTMHPAHVVEPIVLPTNTQALSASPDAPDAGNDLMADDVLGIATQADTTPAFTTATTDNAIADAMAATPDDAFAAPTDADPPAAFAAGDLSQDVTALDDSSMLDDPMSAIIDTNDDLDDNQPAL